MCNSVWCVVWVCAPSRSAVPTQVGEDSNTYGHGLKDFSWAWYRDVGTDYLYILLLSCILPVAASLLACACRQSRLKLRTAGCCSYQSQHTMDEVRVRVQGARCWRCCGCSWSCFS